MEFKSIKDLSEDIREHILPKIPRTIKVVYGVPRSGMLPASIIATAIGADLYMVGHEEPIMQGTRRKRLGFGVSGEDVLLVDDSSNRGNSIRKAKEILGIECLVCCIYVRGRTKDSLDVHGPVIEGRRLFEWNFNGTRFNKKCIYDMDGVICEDIKVKEDNQEEYLENIINTPPLYLPQGRIRAICTNRLEKYREVTEEWLKLHGVECEKLIMRDFETPKERRKHGNPGKYKGDVFSNDSRASLFVESHDKQAKVISNISSKPCLSIQSMRLFNG